MLPPKHTDILVLGGGPAGSYAASALARERLDVTVFEAAKFPRYHVGESLIPSVRHYLRFIGAEQKLINHGFVSKPGAAIKFNQYKREGYTDFVAIGHNNSSWNVIRSEFDHLLMNHARSSGASVYELTKVTSINFCPTDPNKPISVTWTHTPPPLPLSPPSSPTTSRLSSSPTFQTTTEPTPITGTTTFKYLIDATGRAGLMSTRYLKNRHFNASLKNIAVWGYWTDVGTYGVGTKRQGAPYFEALTDESGWAWFIPLHNGTTSVGIVMNEKSYNEKNKSPLPPSPFMPSSTPNPTNSVMTAHYICNVRLAPGVVSLITQKGKMRPNSVQSASDFSYSAPIYAGNGYRIVGDAGAFIDPFFSSGVHLAFTSALSAASTVCASIRGDCSELDAAEFHTKRVGTSYTRFQVVVLSAYKQIRAQSDDVLSDIDEDNYDRAFSFLRPVIQGAADMGTRLSENELQKSLDFCVNLFNPTTPEQHDRLEGTIKSRDLLDVHSTVLPSATLMSAVQIEPKLKIPAVIDRTTGKGWRNPASSSDSDSDDDFLDSGFEEELSSDTEKAEETKMVLNKVNARRVIHAEYALNNLEDEALGGYVVRLLKGNLGLSKV